MVSARHSARFPTGACPFRPNRLSLTEKQEKMLRALSGIHRQFQDKKPIPEGKKGSWRRREELFQEPEGDAPPLGAPTFAPAFFPVGRSVSLLIAPCCVVLTAIAPPPRTVYVRNADRQECRLGLSVPRRHVRHKCPHLWNDACTAPQGV